MIVIFYLGTWMCVSNFSNMGYPISISLGSQWTNLKEPLKQLNSIKKTKLMVVVQFIGVTFIRITPNY
jgi:hypothetical protein